MRLYEITTAPHGDAFIVVHAYAGNESQVRELFASIYPAMEIASVRDLFAEKPGILGDPLKRRIDPPPAPVVVPEQEQQLQSKKDRR